jgi:predicted DNA-binding antitoxin AbrB/MazE fold protein
MKTIHAVYESGVFRPLEPVGLPERTEVEFEPRLVAQPEEHDSHLDGIYAILGERYQSGEHDLAARHNEHQPPVSSLL